MSAAAQLGREVADLDHADFISVLFAEKGHGFVLVKSDVNRHIFDDFDPLIAQHFFIDQVLNVLQLFVFDSGEMRKIKAQVIGRHQRPRLLHMLA